MIDKITFMNCIASEGWTALYTMSRKYKLKKSEIKKLLEECKNEMPELYAKLPEPKVYDIEVDPFMKDSRKLSHNKLAKKYGVKTSNVMTALYVYSICYPMKLTFSNEIDMSVEEFIDFIRENGSNANKLLLEKYNITRRNLSWHRRQIIKKYNIEGLGGRDVRKIAISPEEIAHKLYVEKKSYKEIADEEKIDCRKLCYYVNKYKQSYPELFSEEIPKATSKPVFLFVTKGVKEGLNSLYGKPRYVGRSKTECFNEIINDFLDNPTEISAKYFEKGDAKILGNEVRSERVKLRVYDSVACRAAEFAERLSEENPTRKCRVNKVYLQAIENAIQKSL